MTRPFRSPHIGGEQQPLFTPASTWTPPAELPDLRSCKVIAVDCETKDEGLAAGRGPSWPQRMGYVCGVAIAWPGGLGSAGSFYVPVRHPDTPCFDRAAVARWLEDHAAAGVRFLFHNAHYDIGWLRADLGLTPRYSVEDTQCQAVMLDENRISYQLDAICHDLGLPGKDEAGLREALAVYGYPSAGGNYKANIHRLPARYVGPYAEADAMATLAVFEEQRRRIEAVDTDHRECLGLMDAYRVEMDLVSCVHEMRWRGVKVNVERAAEGAKQLRQDRDTVLSELSRKLGRHVTMDDIGRTRWLEEVFTQEGIRFPRTMPTRSHPNGQPSFTAGSTGWMPKNPHWLPQLVVKADKLNKAAKDFLEGHVLAYAHRGRVHASINQYRNEDGLGTRTHRFSYSNPPLQQMPKRDEELMGLVRGCFEPEDGEVWVSCDYPQQEYRLIVHFSEVLDLPKAHEAGDKYRSDPDTDFHDMVTEMTNPRVDFTQPPYGDHKSAEFKRLRKPAKDANFAKAFGAGVGKFAEMTNLSQAEAAAIMENYDRELPFVRALAEMAEGVASKWGDIRLIDGARLHYEQWEPRYRDWGREGDYAAKHGGGTAPCSREEALRRVNDGEHPWHGKIRRSFTRKAGNGLIQGSAARMTKAAMVACWREGIVPLLQVHDELDASVASQVQGDRLAAIMSNAVPLTVPIVVKPEYGRTWGDAKHGWDDVR